MLAIDANILVRHRTGDRAEQSARARAPVDGNDVPVGDTVMLETARVRRSACGSSRLQVTRALRHCPPDTVSAESPAIVARALDVRAAGMDGADARQLTRAVHGAAFVTSDRKLVDAAGIGTTRPP